MKLNQAIQERGARVVLGVVLVVVGFAAMSGAGGVVLGIIGLILLVTGAVGWCPLYRLFGFSTNRAG